MAPGKPGRYEFSPESLVKIRTQLSLSQTKMAKLLGIPANTLSRWESGTTTPDAESLASVYSAAMEHSVTPGFFRKRRPVPKQSKERSRLLVMWDFQNVPPSRGAVAKAADWITSQLGTRFAAASYRRFKAFSHPSQTAATDELQKFGWRVWEDDEDMDDEIIAQCKSDCGQEPKDTILVLVTKDGDFTELVEELKERGVDVYLGSPAAGPNQKLVHVVG